MLSTSAVRPAPPFLGGSFRLALPVLFNAAFMRQHTDDETITAFFARGGYLAFEWDDVQSIAKDELDAHVRGLTSFPSWLGMMDAAVGFFFADMYRCLAER